MSSEEEHSLIYLSPYDDESISHYLGRWYRQEVVSADSYSLGKRLGLGTILWRWENFHFNPPPTPCELQEIDKLMGLGLDRLRLMFPPAHEPIKPKPIRLCATCYAEKPYHRLKWQFQSTAGCHQHRLRLLSKCPGCEKPFLIPALIRDEKCTCGMYFRKMGKYQKPF